MSLCEYSCSIRENRKQKNEESIFIIPFTHPEMFEPQEIHAEEEVMLPECEEKNYLKKTVFFRLYTSSFPVPAIQFYYLSLMKKN